VLRFFDKHSYFRGPNETFLVDTVVWETVTFERLTCAEKRSRFMVESIGNGSSSMHASVSLI